VIGPPVIRMYINGVNVNGTPLIVTVIFGKAVKAFV
jgi:hypothetical protein